MHWGYGWGMGVGGWTLMVIFWVLVILVIFYLLRNIGAKPQGGETPLDILKKRYAKGEINREEFERMKEDLKKG
jgi:putative membrane protein